METTTDYEKWTIFGDTNTIKDFETEIENGAVYDIEDIAESYDPTIWVGDNLYMIHGYGRYIMLCRIEN